MSKSACEWVSINPGEIAKFSASIISLAFASCRSPIWEILSELIAISVFFYLSTKVILDTPFNSS